MRPSSYTMQHLQQSNMQPLSGELGGSFSGTRLFGGLSTLAVVGVAVAFATKQDWAPLAGAFLAGHFVGGGSLAL